MIYIIAKCISKKENIEETKNELLALIAPTREEKGCISYDLHQDQDRPEVFYFYEIWETRSLLDAHLKNDHLVAWVNKAEDLLASPMEVSITDKL